MSNEEIEWLNTAMKQTSDKRLYERYLAVRLRLEGHTFDEIGELLSRARQTISIYWQTYQTQGLSGLELDHSPGQPPKLTEEERHRLAAMLEQHVPADMGFETRYTWTLPLVAEWIKREFDVTLSVRGISAMLKRMNFSFTKATYTLAHANEETQTFFRKHTFAQLKKQVEAEQIDHLLFLKTSP
ncbi:transposase [Paenibacillus rhizoplanae]